MGRPPLPQADRKQHVIAIRVRDDVYAEILRSAAANGRTLAEEVVFRVEQSVKADKADRDLADEH
jgi:hypothetical protein